MSQESEHEVMKSSIGMYNVPEVILVTQNNGESMYYKIDRYKKCNCHKVYGAYSITFENHKDKKYPLCLSTICNHQRIKEVKFIKC